MNKVPFQLPAAVLLLGGSCLAPAFAEGFSSALLGGSSAQIPTLANTVLTPLVVAGDPNGLFPGPDSVAARVDPNVPSSPYAGVVSLFLDAPGPGGFICTGTVISPVAVLTAGHCVDFDNNGSADVSGNNVTVVFNNTGAPELINALTVTTHPDFTGFNNPVGIVNDDLAIVRLAQPVPAGTPIYPLLPAGSVDPAFDIFKGTFTGYGTTGDGINGYTAGSSSFTVKHTGANLVEAYDVDDEGSGATELWYADFERTTSNVVFPGPPFDVYDGSAADDALGALIPGWDFAYTLGNTVESNTGPGDSGGPLFVEGNDGNLYLAGTTTFGADVLNTKPGGFGSLNGGIWLESYNDWIVDTYNAWNVGLAVPEPSTYAAGLAVGALGLVTWRQRRRNAARG